MKICPPKSARSNRFGTPGSDLIAVRPSDHLRRTFCCSASSGGTFRFCTSSDKAQAVERGDKDWHRGWPAAVVKGEGGAAGKSLEILQMSLIMCMVSSGSPRGNPLKGDSTSAELKNATATSATGSLQTAGGPLDLRVKSMFSLRSTK